MTDLKKKLDRLKQEREVRDRTRKIPRPEGRAEADETPAGDKKSVEKIWAELNKDATLSTKEKLEQLIHLKPHAPSKPKAPVFEQQPIEPLNLLENTYDLKAKYGRFSFSQGLEIPGDVLACFSREPAFSSLDLSTALFIDLETTGLSGGSGVIPFLAGLGYYRDDRFWVVQYFLGDPAEEDRMISEMSQFFKDMEFRSLVTYNGKVFDIPLLETRFVLSRQPFPLADLPHLDFLFPARRLWGHKYENCRLFNLALEVVRTGRTEDIPSAEIPWRYFQFLQTGNFSLVEPVIYHNAEDILSLLGVVIAGAQIFSGDVDTCLADGMDYFGAGKIMESIGDQERSAEFFQQALAGDLTVEVSLSVKRRLSLKHKKEQAWVQAVSLWKEMVDSEQNSRDMLFSFRELAMYFEHREKAYETARRYAEEGLVTSFGLSDYYERDFRRRLERLKEKMKREKEQEQAEEKGGKKGKKK
jgi:uncharacterized protein YprB with RNaseH-like and TPR domain